jgi:hypothetical protein
MGGSCAWGLPVTVEVFCSAGIPEGSKKIIIDTGFRIQAEQPSEWRDDVPRLFGQLLRHIGHV